MGEHQPDARHMSGRRADGSEPGGESVCWLDRVCPDCGALTDEEQTRCPRCGCDMTDTA